MPKKHDILEMTVKWTEEEVRTQSKHYSSCTAHTVDLQRCHHSLAGDGQVLLDRPGLQRQNLHKRVLPDT